MTEILPDDVPAALAEAVAKVIHDRHCTLWDGKRPTTEPFSGDHKRLDIRHAAMHVADVCQAAGVTPGEIASR